MAYRTDEDPTTTGRFAWAGRSYLIQTGATVVSGLGNAGAPIATAFAVLHMGGGATEIGYVTGARLLATLVFLLIGGAVADRLPRHRVMVAANVGNALSQGVLAALVLAGSVRLWQLVLLSAAGGVGQAFFAPAAEGVIMESVDQQQAPRAFALFRTALNSSLIGGAALGGALVAAVGPAGCSHWTRSASPPPAPCDSSCARLPRCPGANPALACSPTCGTAGTSSPRAAGCGRWWSSTAW
nr:MFS transporter [Kitasatospora mediocidica]